MKQLFFALLLVVSHLSSAQSVSGKIVDKNEEPIAYATIRVADFGTVSNLEGDFELNVGELPPETTASISFIGYKTLEMDLEQLSSQEVFVLEKDVLSLEEVFLTNKKYTPEELIEKVLERADSNYLKRGFKQRVYHRNQTTFYPIDFEQDIKKSTMLSKKQRGKINEEIENMIDKARGRSSTGFEEILSDFYRPEESPRVANVIKATRLKDEAKDLSASKMIKKMMEVVSTHLDTTHTYKISSGIFRLDSDAEADDMDLENLGGDEDAATASGAISTALYIVNLKNRSLDFLHKPKRYDYSLQPEATTYNGKTVYVLDFEPKRSSADFEGRLYITADDFAVVKMDFAIAPDRDGEKVNLKFLLGVKYVQEDGNYSITYAQNQDDGKYVPQLLSVRSVEYTFFNRNFKFKRNKNTPEDEKKKLKFEFLMEARVDIKDEFYFTDFARISLADIEGIEMDKKIEFQKIDRYDPSIWSDYNILPAIKELEEYQTE
jgi:hypothetical protein